jgi:hypothetical protein
MVNSKSFDYCQISKTFTADISDLGSRVFERIYPDACDQGIVMMSYKTGVEAKFVVEKEERDRENDLTGWILVPTADTLRKIPHLNGVKVIIFND